MVVFLKENVSRVADLSSEDLARVSTCHGKSSKDYAASYNMKHFLCAFICIYHSLMRWVIYVKNFEFLNVAKFLTLKSFEKPPAASSGKKRS